MTGEEAKAIARAQAELVHLRIIMNATVATLAAIKHEYEFYGFDAPDWLKRQVNAAMEVVINHGW